MPMLGMAVADRKGVSRSAAEVVRVAGELKIGELTGGDSVCSKAVG